MVSSHATLRPLITLPGEHLDKNITQVYNGPDTSFDSFPANDQKDPDAYKAAIDGLDEVDLTSQDVALAIMQTLEKDRWFLFAHLAE